MITLIKWLPFLAKLGGIGKVLAFIPGGGLFSLVFTLIGTLAGWVLSFFRWLVRDLEDAFKEMPRLVVRAICVLAALAGGFYLGVKHDKALVDHARAQTWVWQSAHAELLNKAKAIDAADNTKHKEGLKAKAAAEAAERAKIDAEEKAAVAGAKPPGPAVTDVPKRVQPAASRKASHCNPKAKQQGLFGDLPTFFGGALPCKSI
jgi:hypothetical protein